MFENDDGFLTESLGYVREAVRLKYADLYNLLRRVNRFAVHSQHLISIHPNNQQEEFVAKYFARTLTSTQASILLLETGLPSQAQILLRAAMETHFALAAIVKDSSVINKLIDGHRAEQKRVAKTYKHFQNSELKQSAVEVYESGRLQPFLESTATPLSAFDLAQKAGLEDLYRTAYMIFSWPTHGAIVDLERHVVKGENGHLVEFRNEPEVENQEFSWFCAIELLLIALNALAEVFSSVDKACLEQLFADLNKLASTSSLKENDTP